ncbi:CCC motif membrane protein [Cellulophaga lytica]|uniref:CCC motif membrane protein n=1 Tax=Cellulophaga lytica TaxID=979 RepID=UPI0026E2A532|nr:CCC motif membrane protein [Cellulophaga lytica]MDO6853553.1 CCC motif membrane protein [Cellulophaga lytica]
MKKEKLPNSKLIYLLAMLSCFLFCFGGFSILFALISYFLAKKSERIYRENQDEYHNIKSVKKGKVIAIIGIVLNLIILGITIWTLATIGWDSWSDEFVRRWNAGVESNSY